MTSDNVSWFSHQTNMTSASPPYWSRTAIGIMDHEDGYFARVKQALDDWGATIYR